MEEFVILAKIPNAIKQRKSRCSQLNLKSLTSNSVENNRTLHERFGRVQRLATRMRASRKRERATQPAANNFKSSD